MKRKKLGIAIGVIAVATIAAYYVAFLVIGSVSPFTSISEILNSPESYDGKEVRVIGTVTSLKQDERSFLLTGEDGFLITVSYEEAMLPGVFGEGSKTMVRGIFTRTAIRALEIRVECPSK